MGQDSKIEWTDHTFNPWIGCSKVSDGCDNCYAETLNHRMGWTEWGPHGERYLTSDGNWNAPKSWDRQAAKAGVRKRVFCSSLADVFDNRAPEGARERLWELIKATPNLDWLLLTKRPENIDKMLPADWVCKPKPPVGGEQGTYPNVCLGISAENHLTFYDRWYKLTGIACSKRFVSYEPALGSIRLDPNMFDARTLPGWFICGGESGPAARRMKKEWVVNLMRECRELGIPFFFKQWGTYSSNPLTDSHSIAHAKVHDPETNGKGGALIDGMLLRQIPRWLKMETK